MTYETPVMEVETLSEEMVIFTSACCDADFGGEGANN